VICARRFTLVAVAIFGQRHFHADAGDLLEAGFRAFGVAVAQVDEEVELDIGSIA
jgi:hypothetical protein